MRKILTFLFAALMSVGMWAAPSWVRPGDTWNEGTKTLTVNSDLSYDAYSYNQEIEHVIISSGVTSIGYGAFYDCSSLTSVTIPNSVTSIGDDAFQSCTNLTSITIPTSVTSIGDEAFAYCSGLTSIVVESGNTTYDSRESCNAIIETSSNKLIAGCKNTIIPSSVTSIEKKAFYFCEGLNSVTIPEGVTSIGQSAFHWCTGLTSITIPSSVTNIGKDAFYRCTNITDVYCYADPNNLTWNDGYCDDFKNADHATFCHVKACALATYEANWGGTEYNKKTSTGVNVTFKGDLPGDCPAPAPQGQEITPYVDPQNASVYYSTFYDSAKKYELPEGVEAYVATIGENVLNLTKIAEAGQVIPNDNAVILKSSVTPFTLTLSEADAVTFSANNDLQGTDEEKTTPANCYVLSGEDGVVGFYQYNGTKLNPHKAYVLFSGSNAPRRLRFVFDAATGVENVQGNVQSTKVIENGQLIIIRDGVRYNAQGQIVK